MIPRGISRLGMGVWFVALCYWSLSLWSDRSQILVTESRYKKDEKRQEVVENDPIHSQKPTLHDRRQDSVGLLSMLSGTALTNVQLTASERRDDSEGFSRLRLSAQGSYAEAIDALQRVQVSDDELMPERIQFRRVNERDAMIELSVDLKVLPSAVASELRRERPPGNR